jgi:two-component system phosphate regulon sensor histidine kinase PhoR
MNDLRGLSRGPKTAAVVVAVVLLQVIVVAVVGLGAISRDREAGAGAARDEDRRRAEATAQATLVRVSEGLRTAVAAASVAALRARDPSGERAFAPQEWSRPFTWLARVDRSGRVRSFGGTRLYVPIETAVADERAADADRRVALEKRIDDGVGDVQEARREYARRHWMHVDRDYPRGAAEAFAHAAHAVEEARGKDPAGPEAIAATHAVLLAFEAIASNEGRPLPPRAEAQVAFFARELDALAARVPGEAGEALVQGLSSLRSTRRAFEALRRRVPEDARAAQAAPPRVLALPRSDDVIAIAPLPQVEGAEPESLFVRLDRRLLAAIAEEEGVPASERESGFSTRVVPRTDPTPSDAIVRQELLVPHDFDTGLDVLVVRRGGTSALAVVGPREVFYWFILGLAALGLVISGLLLLRVFRREVRLARLKTDFVSNLSHELKTPLTSISLFVEMVRDGRASSGEDLREAMEVVAQETDRLQRIVARMIDVVRREAAPTAFSLEPGDLNEPVRAACERFRRLERAPGLSLSVALAPDLPPVRMDAAAIDDVVTNLLSNAWKYRRGDAADIRVATRAARGRVEVVVEDDGIGIPRGERRRVFEMFYRAEDYLSRAVPGTGLGLALVRTIVRAHGGRVRVESSPRGGTAFRVRLPAAKGVAFRPAPARRAPAAAPTESAPAVARAGAREGRP